MKRKWRFIFISEQREHQIFLYLILAIAFSLPFQAIYNSLLTIALLLFWLVCMRKEFSLQRIVAIGAISILFWLALLGLTYTQNVEEGLFRIQQKSLLLIFPLILGTITIDWHRTTDRILSTFVLAVLLACVVCLLDATVYWLQHDSTERFFFENLLAGHWVDLYPYILSYACLICSIILAESLLGTLALGPTLASLKIKFAFLAFFIFFVLLLSVKQVILAMMLLVIGYSFRMGKRLVVLTLLTSVIILIGAFFSLPTLRARIEEAFAEEGKQNPLHERPELGTPLNGVALRRALWVCTFDVIKSNPVIGVGTGDGQDELQAAYEKRQFVLAARYNRFNAHNQYLQTLVNVGAIGLVAWLLSLSWLLITYRSNRLLVLVLGVLLFAMLTESMLETNKGILIMAFLVSILSFSSGKNLLRGNWTALKK